MYSMSDIARIDRDAGPVPVSEAAGTAVRREPGAVALIAPDVGIDKPDELTWWDWTVFLLHTAAEIEHALMVQYLYAAYSLTNGDFRGPDAPPDAADLVRRWQGRIIGIAREEMAHLLTVQNLLRFVGGPLNLEREDFPFRAFLYPFPLQLEPLSKTSLAKYVATEMPARPPQPPDLIQEIVERATGATGGLPVNRVGPLYAELVKIVGDPAKLPDAALRPETATTLQAGDRDWRPLGSMLVRAVRSRAEAADALKAIGEQGEGQETPPVGAPESHFDRFIKIYTAFPETDPRRGPVGWSPAGSVPTNPNTLRHPSTDPDLERGRITHPTTRLWAHLFNVRYRMLLADLTHALHLPGPMQEGHTLTGRGHLRNWTFVEMTGNPDAGMEAGLRGIARMLVTLPLKETPAAADPIHAGPPFELPYTLNLPDGEADRWRLHLALLDTSHDLIARIRAVSGTNAILDELTDTDLAARAVVEEQLVVHAG
jgi:hypothetical protein